ncbi:hypothetical protein SCB49_03214 [unidentified eubacterium SCB49]|nr:hypothetical protein SCB49_03214 [unidentified eubacterium SCB49]
MIFCLACKNQREDFVKSEKIPSKIDSLKTEQEVQNFVRNLQYPSVRVRDFNDSIFSYKALEKFELKKIQDFNRGRKKDRDSLIKILADSIKINRSFYKADLDNNGYTDLIIIGDDKSCSGSGGSCDYSVYSLMNFANDSINPVDLVLDNSFNSAIIPKITIKNSVPILEIFGSNNLNSNTNSLQLSYKYGTFVEKNNEPKEYSIEKIEYSAEACFGSCPIFELSIDKNRKAKLNAIEYNSSNPDLFEYEITEELKGKFQAIIDLENYQEIIGLLNYLDFPTLEDDYMVNATDNPSCKLTITYNQGQVKEIRDYGKVGTLGLQEIYKRISRLKTNQSWE